MLDKGEGRQGRAGGIMKPKSENDRDRVWAVDGN